MLHCCQVQCQVHTHHHRWAMEVCTHTLKGHQVDRQEEVEIIKKELRGLPLVSIVTSHGSAPVCSKFTYREGFPDQPTYQEHLLHFSLPPYPVSVSISFRFQHSSSYHQLFICVFCNESKMQDVNSMKSRTFCSRLEFSVLEHYLPYSTFSRLFCL